MDEKVGYIHSFDLICCCDSNLELSLCRLTVRLPRELYRRVVVVQRRPSLVVRGHERRNEAIVMGHAVVRPERRQARNQKTGLRI